MAVRGISVHPALLSAANSVPNDYFEAALLDGRSKPKAHMRITIPLMQEAYKYCLIIAITGGLNSFAVMNIMTGGGPGTASYTLTYLMYRSAFVVNKYGYGRAAAVPLVVQSLIVCSASTSSSRASRSFIEVADMGKKSLLSVQSCSGYFFYFYAVISLYPIVWMFFYSFKNNSEIFVTNPFGFPEDIPLGELRQGVDHVQCPDVFHEQP